MQRSESHPDGEWMVRRVTGASASKSYVCPGCSQVIAPGVPHVVAWPAEDLLGQDAALGRRRHWHPSCWESRLRRRPR